MGVAYIINRDNLRPIGDVEGKIEKLRYEVEKAECKLNSLTLKLDNLKALADQVEEYFSLLDKQERTTADELRLKMYKSVLERNNITTYLDYEYLKSIVADMEQKAPPLKENFEKCRRIYKLYSNIAKPTTRFREGIISRGSLKKNVGMMQWSDIIRIKRNGKTNITSSQITHQNILIIKKTSQAK